MEEDSDVWLAGVEHVELRMALTSCIEFSDFGNSATLAREGLPSLQIGEQIQASLLPTLVNKRADRGLFRIG